MTLFVTPASLGTHVKCRIWDPTSDLQNRHLARQGSPGVMGCPVFNSAMLCVTEGTGAGGCGGRRPLSQQDSEMKTQLPHLMFLIKEEIESCWDPSNSESSATAAWLTPGKGQAQMELSRRRPHGIHLGRRELYPWRCFSLELGSCPGLGGICL